jgi:DNA-binding PadR family transcriptional regulator
MCYATLRTGLAVTSKTYPLNGKPSVDFVELHILHHAVEAEIFGLWMIEELAGHGYRLNASQLYPKLHRLEKSGYLKRRDHVVEGKLRKYYRATAAGRAYFRGQKKLLMELAAEALSARELQAVLESRLARDGRKQKRK